MQKINKFVFTFLPVYPMAVALNFWGKLTRIFIPIFVVFGGGFFLVKQSNGYQISHGNQLSIPQNFPNVLPFLSSRNTFQLKIPWYFLI